MAELSGHVATVSGQEGDRVLISVPMVGFPEGFTLRAGDRVAVQQTERGPIALPLVQSFEPGHDAAILADGGDFIQSDATIRSGSGERAVVFVLERDQNAGGPRQIVSVRRDR